MRRILAIAGLAIRAALRSRVVATLLVALALTTVLLPYTLRGDGTLEGFVRLQLQYTLGLAQIILSAATLWAGCAAIASEVGNQTMHLTAVKPVKRAEVWAGKWLGIVALDAALVGFCGLAAYAALAWHTRPSRLTADERRQARETLLVARGEVRAVPEDVEAAAQATLKQAEARGDLPPDATPETLLKEIRRGLLTQAYSVPPGYRRRWEFDLPPGALNGTALVARVKFASSRTEDQPLEGLWFAGPPEDAERLQMPFAGLANAAHEFILPTAPLAGARKLVLDFGNADPAGATAVFDPEKGVTLLYRAGGFAPNLARALLVMLAHLAFLAALGVTVGSFFTLPVAGFLSLSVVFMVLNADFVSTLGRQPDMIPWAASRGKAQGVSVHAAQAFYRALGTVLQPLKGEDALGRLSTGMLVSGGDAARALGVQAGVYVLVLAALGSWGFHRREVAMPSI